MSTITSQFYAAYDADTIYAVATHPTAAIATAIEEAGSAADMLRFGARLNTAEISEALFDQIERQGWDGRRQSFAVAC